MKETFTFLPPLLTDFFLGSWCSAYCSQAAFVSCQLVTLCLASPVQISPFSQQDEGEHSLPSPGLQPRELPQRKLGGAGDGDGSQVHAPWLGAWLYQAACVGAVLNSWEGRQVLATPLSLLLLELEAALEG